MSRGRRSLREKIGALIIPRVFGDRRGLACFDLPEAQEYLEEFPPRILILFGGNRESVPALLHWIRSEMLPHPPVFAADLEEGPGQQVGGATHYPPAMAMGAAGQEDLAHAIGLASAAEAIELGIRWFFGPVLDLGREPRNPVMGSRTIGSNPEQVAILGKAYCRGLIEGGAIPTAKHFPGHGSTAVDSHENLATVPFPREWLERQDLLPFRQAVEDGVPSLMVGHLAVPALDPSGLPASLSFPIVEGFLRQRWGYQGVVVTDALMMGGVGQIPAADLGLQALRAGNDLLLMPTNPMAAARKIEEAVLAGPLSENRIDRSLERLDRLLMRYPGTGNLPLETRKLDLELARQSLTLMGTQNRLSALQPGEPFQIRFWNERKEAGDWEERFLAALRKRGLEPGSKGRKVLVLFSDNRAWRGRAGLRPESEQEVSQILAAERALVIGFCSPFVLAPFIASTSCLCAYGSCQASLDAVVEALAGRVEPGGILPVPVT